MKSPKNLQYLPALENLITSSTCIFPADVQICHLRKVSNCTSGNQNNVMYDSFTQVQMCSVAPAQSERFCFYSSVHRYDKCYCEMLNIHPPQIHLSICLGKTMSDAAVFHTIRFISFLCKSNNIFFKEKLNTNKLEVRF